MMKHREFRYFMMVLLLGAGKAGIWTTVCLTTKLMLLTTLCAASYWERQRAELVLLGYSDLPYPTCFCTGPGTTGKLVKLAFDSPSLPRPVPLSLSNLSQKGDWKLAERKMSRTGNHLVTSSWELSNYRQQTQQFFRNPLVGAWGHLICLCPGLAPPSTAWALLMRLQCCRSLSLMVTTVCKQSHYVLNDSRRPACAAILRARGRAPSLSGEEQQLRKENRIKVFIPEGFPAYCWAVSG